MPQDEQKRAVFEEAAANETDVRVLVVGGGLSALPLLRILGNNKNNNCNSSSSSSSSGSKRCRVTVTLANSLGRRDWASYCHFVDRVLKVPRPDRDLEGFASAICRYVKSHRIDRNDNNDKMKRKVIIVPVGEEAVFLAQIAKRIRTECSVGDSEQLEIVASSAEILTRLCDRFEFFQCLARFLPEEQIPRTFRVRNGEQLMEAAHSLFAAVPALPKIVVKSPRGRTKHTATTISCEDFKSSSLQDIRCQFDFGSDNDNEAPVLVQEFVEGLELSAYTFARDGQVLAHVCYRPRLKSDREQGRGAGFSPVRVLATPSQWERSLQLVRTMVSNWNFTGHFCLHMVERFNGELVAVDFDPGVGSGLAFLSPRFSSCLDMKSMYLGLSRKQQEQQLAAPSSPKHVLTFVLTLAYIWNAPSRQESLTAAEFLSQSYDDIWWCKDPGPFLAGIALLLFRYIAATSIVVFRCGAESATHMVKQWIEDEIVTFHGGVWTATDENQKNKATLESVGRLAHDFVSDDRPHEELKILVTGATGFLGGKLVKVLSAGGFEDDDIKLPFDLVKVKLVTATGRSEERGRALMRSLKSSRKTRFVAADLSQAQETFPLVQKHNVIFHCAALCSPWGPWERFISANVKATENLVQACRMVGHVHLFVHISSPSVCFSIDTGDRLNVKEDEPLPTGDKQPTRYSATKQMAEDIVLDVAKRSQFSCIILRPRAIFGPGDTTLFPTLLDRIRTKKLRILGNERSIGQSTYVDNIVYACMCCLGRAPKTAKIYNITDGEPQYTWETIRMICERLNLKYPSRHIPHRAAFVLGFLMELFSTIAMLCGREKEPFLMRYTVNLLSRSTTLDTSAARTDLGYHPVVTTEEGLRRFLATQL